MSSETAEATAHELSALTDLLQSDGWALFRALVDQEWGDAVVVQRIAKCLELTPAGDQAAVDDRTQHVLSAQRAVRGLLQLPVTRVAQLKRGAEPPRTFGFRRRA